MCCTVPGCPLHSCAFSLFCCRLTLCFSKTFTVFLLLFYLRITFPIAVIQSSTDVVRDLPQFTHQRLVITTLPSTHIRCATVLRWFNNLHAAARALLHLVLLAVIHTRIADNATIRDTAFGRRTWF